jgi:hypothetical protein
MKLNIRQLKLKLKKAKETVGGTGESWEKTNKKKFGKKIKISPFLFFGVAGAVAVFLLFNLVLMPAMEKKSSDLGINNPVILRVVEADHHFNKEEVQTQFNLRKIVFSTDAGDNGSAGTPTGNTGTGVPAFKPAIRPNPFN